MQTTEARKGLYDTGQGVAKKPVAITGIWGLEIRFDGLILNPKPKFGVRARVYRKP